MNKLLLAFSLIAVSTSANAYDKNTVHFGIGISDMFDENLKEPVGTVEWRGAALAQTSTLGIPNVSPLVGINMTTEGAGMVYAGAIYDWNFYDAWSLAPSFSAGIYWDGKGKDMGGALQFRPAIEVNYKLDNIQRVGVSLAHISNFGIHDEDPGKEDLTFNYSIAY